MFAYRHLFHAGNFADVLKHALLARLFLALAKKEKPYCFVDTHAGVGRYDLTHEWARKNAEFEAGIGRLWNRDDVPALLEPYLAAVRAENPDGRLRFYPGSPAIARRLRRSGDRLVFSEMNKSDATGLTAYFERERGVTVLVQDAYQTLRSHLPPRERRGLVLVDSSFDRAGEFARLAAALAEAHKRWETGVYSVWYPLMTPGAMQTFYRAVATSGVRRILQIEIEVHPAASHGPLRGCGLLVVNPPFGFEAEAREIVAWLAPMLAQTIGAGDVRWLVPE